MSDLSSFHQFILLIVFAIVAAYVVASLLVRGGQRSMPRVLLTSVLATVIVHAFLIRLGEGTDQFVLVSVLIMLVYGFVGGWVLDWLRVRLMQPKGGAAS